jgi:predicted secreted protein
MAEVKGVNGVVKIAPTGGSAVALLHVTSFSLEETTETIDVTSMGDTSRAILATFKGFSGTVDGYWDIQDAMLGHDSDSIGTGADSSTDLVDTTPQVVAGDTIDFELYPNGTSSTYYSGSAIVTSISRSASFDGAVEYSIAFEGTGDLTYAA